MRSTLLKNICWMLLLSLVAVPVFATNYYVSPTGDDANTGLSVGDAWYNLDRGDRMGILTPGDTVFIAAGIYNPTVTQTLSTTGTVDSMIVYMAYGAGYAVLDGGGAFITAIQIDNSNVLLEGLEIRNFNNYGINLAADESVIQNCYIHDIAVDGISLNGNTNTILRNVISTCGNDAINNSAAAANNNIYHNLIYSNTGTGVNIDLSITSLRIINNIIIQNNISLAGAVGNVVAHNDIWNNTTAYFGSITDSAGSISVDPLLTDTLNGDFSLSSGSQCINAGMDLGYYFQGAAPDLGVAEFLPVGGTVYWVSPIGNDSNDGLDSTTAWFTIDNGDRKGLLDPGDTVFILPGTYNYTDSIFLYSNGTPANPIVYKAFGPTRPVVEASSVNTLAAIFITGNHTIVDSIQIDNAQWDGMQIYGDSNLVQNCIVKSSVADGFDIGGWDSVAYGNTIYRNIAYHCGESGFENDSTTITTAYFNNTSVANIGAGINLQGSTSAIRVLNNIFINNNEGIYGAASNIVAFNNAWNNPSGGYNGGVVDSAGSISADPLLTDTVNGDFSLQTGSPCIDTGLDLGYPYNGFAPDIGAVESEASIISYIQIEFEDGTPFTSDTAVTTDLDTTVLYCRGYDGSDSLIGDVAVTWSLSDTLANLSTTLGSFTTVELVRPDTLFIIAEYTGAIVDSSANFIIHTGFPDSIIISPDSATISADSTLTFTSVTYDADGNLSDPAIVPAWSVVGTIGTINPGGLFEATTADTGRIVATAGSVVDTSGLITVIPGMLTSMQITPDSVSVQQNDSIQFSVLAYDADSNLTDFGSISWSSVGIAGTIDSTGLYTASQNGYGKVVVVSSINSIVDTSGIITIEALTISALPIGDKQVLAGQSDVIMIGVQIKSTYASEKYINRIQTHFDHHGSGTIPQVQSNLDSVYLYYDSDNNYLFTGADSLLMQLPVNSEDYDFTFDSIPVPSNDSIAFFGIGKISSYPHDADSLDFYLYRSEVETADSTTIYGADSLNSLGQAIIDCFTASQVTMTSTITDSLLQADSLYHLVTVDLPRNGYEQDMLEMISFKNIGTADFNDIDSLVLYRDEGDESFTAVTDEIRVGTLTYTGEFWTISGLSETLAESSNLFYLIVDPADYPTNGASLSMRIPVNGVNMVSGNDGPIDAAVDAPDSVILVSDEAIIIDAKSVPLSSLVPGIESDPLLSVAITNSSAGSISIDSLRYTFSLTDPDGATPSDLLSQIDSISIYLIQDNTDNRITGDDSLLTTQPVSAESIIIPFTALSIPSDGGEVQLAATVHVNTFTAKNDNIVAIEITDQNDLWFSTSLPVQALFPVTSGPVHTIDAFPVDALQLSALTQQNLFGGQIDQPVMPIRIPSDGYADAVLNEWRMLNTGTLDDAVAIQSMKLWDDMTGDGFTADDTFLTEFTYKSGYWQNEKLALPVPAGGTSFILTVSIDEGNFEIGTFDLAIPVDGIRFESGTDGPDNFPLANAYEYLVFPGNRITAISVPRNSMYIHPGSRNNDLLTFALYNGVNQSHRFSSIELVNSTRSSAPVSFVDQEIGTISLYYDLNKNKLFDNDSLLATGSFENGTLLFSNLNVYLPPESLAYFFVVTDIPFSVIDSDSLAVEVASPDDFTFSPEVDVNGDIPLTNESYLIIDGSVSEQYQLSDLQSFTVNPGDTSITLFAFSPALNGVLEDTLTGFSLVNALGSADTTDISEIRVYLDNNTDNRLQATDTYLGTMSYVTDHWELYGLQIPILDPVPHLLLVGDIPSTATPNVEFQGELPVNACQYTSGNDGPIDNSLTALQTVTVSTSSLKIAYSPLKPAYSTGQALSVNLTVTNLLTSTVDNVYGLITAISDSSKVSLTNSSAGPVSIAAGDSTIFSFTYAVLDTGTVHFSVAGYAADLGDSTSVITTNPTTLEQTPINAVVALINTIPASVIKGQDNVFPLRVKITHNNSEPWYAPIRLDSLVLRVKDDNDTYINANAVFSRLLLSTGYTNLSIIDIVEAQPGITFAFSEPMYIDPGESKYLSLLVDIDSNAVATGFQLELFHAMAVQLVDGNNPLQSISIDPSVNFPMQTASCRIDEPSQAMLISYEKINPGWTNYGQIHAPILKLVLRHPGTSGSSQIQLTGFSCDFSDQFAQQILPDDFITKMSLVRQQTIIGQTMIIHPDSPKVFIPLAVPITLSPGEKDSLMITLDLKEISTIESFQLQIADSTEFVVRDLSSGSLIPTTGDTASLSLESSFPVASGVIQIQHAALPPTLCIESLLPGTVSGGVDSLSLLDLTFMYDADTVYSDLVIDNIYLSVYDTNGAPLDPNNLFDEIGVSINGTAPVYQTSIPLINGAAEFNLNSIILSSPDTLTVTLVADLESDVPYDIFRIAIDGYNDLQLSDAVDSSHTPGFIVDPLCAETFPYLSAAVEIFLPALKPSIQVTPGNAALVYPGMANVTIWSGEISYPTTGLNGPILLNSLSMHMFSRTGEGFVQDDPSTLIDKAYLMVEDQVVAIDSQFVDTSVSFALPVAPELVRNTSVQVAIKLDITANAPVGNYQMQVVDSASFSMTDKNLGTPIYPNLVNASYPLLSTELTVAAAGLEESFTNYPNPFIPGRGDEYGRTIIAYVLKEAAKVDIELFTITGRRVSDLVRDEQKDAGAHVEDIWYGTNDNNQVVIPGTYLCRITVRYMSGSEESYIRKVSVVR